MKCVAQSSKWFLSECAPATGLPRIISLNTFPFLIGRQPESSFCLPMPNVSKLHAKILLNNGRLSVQDLDSRNGTFVNERRVNGLEPLREGDLLQFATAAFRLRREAADEQLQTVTELPVVLAESLCQFDRLMSAESVIPHFQPVVRLGDGKVVGYELLARSGLAGLEMPGAMFQMAERLGHEVQLSMMLRRAGVEAARQLPGNRMFYLNMHPKELGTSQLHGSLEEIRSLAPALRITIEVHEAAVADEKALLGLRAAAHGLDMQLAYDDFGAGQARLDELARVAPDCVKFDMCLVRGLHKATSERRLVTARLVELVRDLGIVPLAEGVEVVEEAEACRQMGFELGQGYYFGRPHSMRNSKGGVPITA